VPTTLQNLIDEAARYVKADLVTTGSPAVYDTDSAEIVQRLISGINDAKNTIARRHYPLYATENITLDADACFLPADTTNLFYKLISVEYEDAAVNTWFKNGVIFTDAPASEEVSVQYQYIPSDMLKLANLVDTDEDDEYPFPDSVDYRILCYRAAQFYYEINGGTSARQKAQVWERKYFEALNKLRTTEDNDAVNDYYEFGEW
jgi:hypothetical protein